MLCYSPLTVGVFKCGSNLQILDTHLAVVILLVIIYLSPTLLIFIIKCYPFFFCHAFFYSKTVQDISLHKLFLIAVDELLRLILYFPLIFSSII